MVLTGDISQIGSSAKISAYAESDSGVGYIQKRFTISIDTLELKRFADCPRIRLSDFRCEFMNGSYGLIYNSTLSEANTIGYTYHNGKLVYRTVRKYTEGFFLLDGTVEFGSGYVYSEIRWSTDKTRWEIYVYSDDANHSTNYNETYMSGKLSAYSDATSL